MTKSLHTPGPWAIENPMGDETPWIVEAGKPTYEWRCIAMVPVKDDDRETQEMPEVEALANARLIAAAPEMLAALQGITRNAALSASWLAPITVAIAKATGKTA